MNLHQCILTNNDCFKRSRMRERTTGVMVHSTGANNPWLKRYVQPPDGLLGVNANNNHWNQAGIDKCVHTFIGKLEDGRIATYQTLPWDTRGWHAGGAANDGYVGFEICEDGLTDRSYFNAVYREAAELTAFLCRRYGLDPLADGVVICHQEGYKRGIASGHSDVLHWFPRHGKSMNDFRRDVAELLKEEDDDMTYFGTIKDVPEWYRPSVQKLIDAGVLKGTDPTGEVLNISEDNCRLLTWLDRLGKLD